MTAISGFCASCSSQ